MYFREKGELYMREKGIEIISFPTEDYLPLKDFESWRVAVLKYCQNTRVENIDWMQKHLYTDEVFVLLAGKCTLILGENGDVPEKFKTIEMEAHKLYSVKKGYWHNHILDESGEVLIVENSNTTDDNSPIYKLNEEEIQKLRAELHKTM